MKILEAIGGASYYLVLDRGLERVLRRPIRLSRTQLVLAWLPLTVLCPLFLLGQALAGYAKFWFCFHTALGRWQTRSESVKGCFAGGLVLSLVGLFLFASIAAGRPTPDTAIALFAGLSPKFGPVGLPFLPEHLPAWGLLGAFLLRWALLPLLGFWYVFQAFMLGPVLWYTFADYLRLGPLPAHLPLCPSWGALALSVILLFTLPTLHRIVQVGPWWRWSIYAARIALCLGVVAAGRFWRTFDQAVFLAVLVLIALAGCVLAGWIISSRRIAVRQLQVFLSLRFLSQRRIAFFAIFAVTLCTAMVLIVISVMGGFLDMVRERSRGLLGDLVMDNYSLQGFPYYQEFIDGELRRMQAPQGGLLVAEATPVIYSYGVLRFLETSVTKPVRIVGIRLQETYRVNEFLNSLFYEKHYPGTTSLERQKQPAWGWDEQAMPRLPEELEAALVRSRAQTGPHESTTGFERVAGTPFPGPGWYESPRYEFLNAVHELSQRTASLAEAISPDQEVTQPPEFRAAIKHDLETLLRHGSSLLERAERPEWRDWAEPFAGLIQSALASLREAHGSFDRDRAETPIDQLQDARLALAPVIERLIPMVVPGYVGQELPGLIIGRDIIGDRDESGQYLRLYARGQKVQLTVAPFTRRGALAGGQPLSLLMRYVDDSRTGVYEIDSMCVYGDFAYLQEVLAMGKVELADDTGLTPPRASQVQIKLAAGADPWRTRDAVEARWTRFTERQAEHAHPVDAHLMRSVEVETWEQKQRVFIAAVEKEKVLVTVLFGVISIVAIFLVLCIFYMIVVEKTRDIGIIKSIGGSPAGVAMIFLAYGGAIGVVGSVLGTLFGWLFVRDINRIQDWLASLNPNLRVWSREVYVFDYIPNTIKITDVVVIVAVAILGCILGAVIPAIRAARMNPVDSLRYE